ncbi:cold shock domain-containing protein [Streptomyces sp. NPDC102283]|uniref:cold shock domain-containing protein n=1 Tax=Streptomyces sp. NPDC102283 TaxID=3366155 RepID=UPI0037F207FE
MIAPHGDFDEDTLPSLEVASSGYQSLEEGQGVEFSVIDGPNGPTAEGVTAN